MKPKPINTLDTTLQSKKVSIDTPIGKLESDSGNHFIDIISVVGVIAALYIGKKLVDRLSKEHTVFTIDKNELDSNTPTYVLDISGPNFVDRVPELKVDHIYHVAAQSGGYYSLKDPYIDCKWNCLGTVNIVKLAQKLNVKKIELLFLMHLKSIELKFKLIKM